MAQIALNDQMIELFLRQSSGEWTAHVDGQASLIRWRWVSSSKLLLTVNGEETAVTLIEHNGTYFVHGYGRSWQLRVQNPLDKTGVGSGDDANAAIAPMPGTVVSINVAEGDTVAKGQLLMTIESMKMLTDIPASRDGEIEEVLVAVGDTFEKNSRLITLKN